MKSSNRREHTSFESFLNDCIGEGLQTPHQRFSRTGTAGFTGSSSFEHAMRLAREGWAKGLSEIERFRAKFSSILGHKIRKAVTVQAMTGFAPDVGAFLNGEPECMFSRTFETQDGPGRIIRIVIGGVVSGGISTEDIIERGALVCALADALEAAGYSCEVTVAYISGRDRAIRSEDFVPAKRAGEPLEMDRLAFVVAHPSMYRRLVFSMQEQNALWFSRNNGSYGSVEQADGDDRGDIYFDSMMLGEISDDNVLKWVESQLAPLGITFDE